MIFRQFCTPDDEISYLLADPVTRYAAVLDPNLQAERDYLGVIRQLDLRLIYVIETHVHESHPSAAPVLRAETGVQLISYRAADLECVDVRVADDESIFLGEEVISVMETPGHSSCSLSYVWRDCVFTGHTLLAGVTGPCRRADADAGRLFDSVRQRLFELPDETLVYPGYVTGKGRISSIGQERATNTDLQPDTTREQFISRKQLEEMHGKSPQEGYMTANRHCEITD